MVGSGNSGAEIALDLRHGLEEMFDGRGIIGDDGMPMATGGRTAPGAAGLYLVGMQLQLSGQLREIGREARAVAAAITAET